MTFTALLSRGNDSDTLTFTEVNVDDLALGTILVLALVSTTTDSKQPPDLLAVGCMNIFDAGGVLTTESTVSVCIDEIMASCCCLCCMVDTDCVTLCCDNVTETM